jgi:hypothetical protein
MKGFVVEFVGFFGSAAAVKRVYEDQTVSQRALNEGTKGKEEEERGKNGKRKERTLRGLRRDGCRVASPTCQTEEGFGMKIDVRSVEQGSEFEGRVQCEIRGEMRMRNGDGAS